MPINYPTPKLYEAIMKDPEIKQEFPGIVERAKSNLFFQRYMKEAVLSDMANALGKMHDVVIEAAKPALIGREIIWVMPTTEAMVRFPLAKLGKAKVTAELSETWLYPEKKDTEDVTPNIEIRAGAEWSKKYVEDASWNVMERQAAEVGRAIGQLETQRVLAFLDANAGTTGTGDADGVLEWAEFVEIWNLLKAKNWSAKVIVLNPAEAADLWTQDQFIHSFIFGDLVDVARGVLGETYLGMKIVVSSLCTAGTVLAVDTDVAAVLLLRRDILTEPFENPRKDRYGVVASERIGLGALRTTAICKYTSI